MFKKEWGEVRPLVFYRLAVILAFAIIPIIAEGRFTDKTHLYLFIGFAVCSMWIAIVLGLSLFRPEFRDSAFEYILTFPYSRPLLLARKMAPRLAVLMVLDALYILCHRLIGLNEALRSSNFLSSPLFSPVSFSTWMFFFFFIGASLSLMEWGNLKLLLPQLMVVAQVLLAYILEKLFASPQHPLPSSFISSALLLAAGGTFFALSYRRLTSRALIGFAGARQKSSTAVGKSYSPGRSKGQKWSILRLEYPPLVRHLLLTMLLLPILDLFHSVTIQYGDAPSSPPPSSPDRLVFDGLMAAMLLIFFAYYAGYGTLGKEFRQKALEYMLTFPSGAKRVILEKILCRLLVLAPAVLAFSLFSLQFLQRFKSAGGIVRSIVHPLLFPLWIALFFLCGVGLSLFEMKNIIALVSLIHFFTLVVTAIALGKIMGRLAIPLPPMLQASLPLLLSFALLTAILAAAFLRLLPRFDLSSPQRHARSAGLSLIVLLSLLSGAGLATAIIL